MERIYNLPITTPVFFDLIQNGKLHSYRATPEKNNIIIKCLQSRNFDEIISENPISSDSNLNINNIIHVSGFGIRIYSFVKPYKKYQNRAGSFFNIVSGERTPYCIK